MLALNTSYISGTNARRRTRDPESWNTEPGPLDPRNKTAYRPYCNEVDLYRKSMNQTVVTPDSIVCNWLNELSIVMRRSVIYRQIFLLRTIVLRLEISHLIHLSVPMRNQFMPQSACIRSSIDRFDWHHPFSSYPFLRSIWHHPSFDLPVLTQTSWWQSIMLTSSFRCLEAFPVWRPLSRYQQRSWSGSFSTTT